MAAGCSAAARLSRLSSECQMTIIEKSPFISLSTCGLRLYAGGDVDNIDALSKTAYGVQRDKNYFQDVKGVTVVSETEADAIDAASTEVTCRNLRTGEHFSLHYDALLVATGAEPLMPDFPFVESPYIYSFYSPSDAIHLREAAQQGKIGNAVVIGADLVGCELSEALTVLWGIETILVEKDESILPDVLDPELSLYLQSRVDPAKVHLMLSAPVERIECNENGSPVVFTRDAKQIKCDVVINCSGLNPNSALAQQIGVMVGHHGGILVDENMKTSVSGVWAAGNCVETRNLVTNNFDFLPFVSCANRMGRVAANSIMGVDDSFKGTVGTVSLKFFDNIVAASGLTMRKAKELRLDVGSVIGCWSDRPEYNPEGKLIFGKLVYEKGSLRLLGLQLVGEGEVTRYIDVFSELLSQGRAINDLLNLEHAFSPDHSSPVSPLNYLGFMAISQEKDGLRNISPVAALTFDGTIIDVRENSEMGSLPFAGESIHIPLAELRSRRSEFSGQERLIFACSKGPRGYEAARLFHNYGHKNVAYLGGGIALYNKLVAKITN